MTLPHPYPPTWRERVARRVGLWPVYGRLALVWWRWAYRSVSLTHPDAMEIAHRYGALREEFANPRALMHWSNTK